MNTQTKPDPQDKDHNLNVQENENGKNEQDTSIPVNSQNTALSKDTQNAIIRFVRPIIEKMPSNMQAPFLIVTLIAILFVPAIIFLAPSHRLIIIGGVFGLYFMVVFFLLISNLPKHAKNSNKENADADVLAEIEVPQNKLPDKDVSDINSLLMEIKEGVATDIKKLYPDIAGITFRANIFMFHEVAEKRLNLAIHEKFRSDMKGYVDEDVTLFPGVGSTGTCFLSGQPNISIKHEKWDDREGVNYILSKKFDPDLVWIITYPILSKQKKVLAVLNIDCLKFPVTEDMISTLDAELRKIQKAHQKEVDKIARIFDKFPRDLITITQKHLNQ